MPAWREDSELFAAVHLSDNGSKQINILDSDDGYTVITSNSPSKIRVVREMSISGITFEHSPWLSGFEKAALALYVEVWRPF